jgi:hypothetical protein
MGVENRGFAAEVYDELPLLPLGTFFRTSAGEKRSRAGGKEEKKKQSKRSV